MELCHLKTWSESGSPHALIYKRILVADRFVKIA